MRYKMSRFNQFVSRIIDLEGGKTIDSGGFTNLGISANAYPDEDIAGMTVDRARFLFARDYYQPLQIDNIKCQYTAFQILAFGINAGVGDCKKHIYSLFGKSALPGESASDVINRLQVEDRDKFLSRLMESIVDHYFNLAEKNPEKYGKYLKGWIHRLCRGIDL